MADVYELMITTPSEKIAGEVFNFGYQNLSIMEIAKTIRKVVMEEFPEKGEIEIVTTPTDDPRSYHINSDKSKKVLGFSPKRTIEDACRDLCAAFKAGKIPNSMDDISYYNVKFMNEIGAK